MRELRETRHDLALWGDGRLGDEDLLALVLGSRRAAVLCLEHRRLGGLARCSPVELEKVTGMGKVRSARLAAALVLGRRSLSADGRTGPLFRTPRQVGEWLRGRYEGETRERFRVLLLDGRHRLISCRVVASGTLTACPVHPRDVFRPALAESAAAVIVAHNHPSGDPSPSAEDLDITGRLQRAGDLVGIRLLDHVILGRPGWVSLAEEGHVSGRTGHGNSAGGNGRGLDPEREGAQTNRNGSGRANLIPFRI